MGSGSRFLLDKLQHLWLRTTTRGKLSESRLSNIFMSLFGVEFFRHFRHQPTAAQRPRSCKRKWRRWAEQRSRSRREFRDIYTPWNLRSPMKITIFPGKYHQNGGFSMAMLVSWRVHPWNLRWIPKIAMIKRSYLFQSLIFWYPSVVLWDGFGL